MSDKLREAAQAAYKAMIAAELSDGSKREWDTAVDGLKDALAEPEQEPVACIKTNGELMWLKKPSTIYSKPRPLYIAPPRREWVGLTHERRYLDDVRTDEEIEYAKAIEAKLKEKNGE